MSDALVFGRLPAIRGMSGANGREKPVDWRYHLDRLFGSATSPFREVAIRLRIARFARRVAHARARWRHSGLPELSEAIRVRRGTIAPDHLTSGAAAEVMAIAAELAARTLELDAFPAQVRGAAVLLSGGVAEMATGSGKTLTAALAAITAVHAGWAVHVITANDYLAERDATELGPLLEAAGVEVGLVTHAIPPEARPSAYRCEVVYASNKEIAFDYLRNRIAVGGDAGPIRSTLEPLHRREARSTRITMRGLPFAIVDEADSVLIDECRTPLIISANARPDPEAAAMALELGDALSEGADYVLDDRRRTVTFTERGKRQLAKLGDVHGGIWRNGVRREEAARQGIMARRYFRRDEHYIVRDGKIELLDEYTGRISHDRVLGDGLHQVLQLKEGVSVTGRRYTQGRITYQRFFRRYDHLAGMTGTAQEVAGELRTVYGLQVVALRPHHRTRRAFRGIRICRTETAKWDGVVERTKRMAGRGRPVLIATRTVLASNSVSEALSEAGIEHKLLNATQDLQEAAIIAQAGQSARVTVATNMAGRGVDIRLEPGVARAGGLHVILTELHEAGRIDRQAIGRAARQGDRGSYEIVLSWEDPLIEIFGGLRRRLQLGGIETFRRAQRRAEKLHARARLDLLRNDSRREDQLTFAGSSE